MMEFALKGLAIFGLLNLIGVLLMILWFWSESKRSQK